MAVLYEIFKEKGLKRAFRDPLTYYEILTSTLLLTVFILDVITNLHANQVRGYYCTLPFFTACGCV